MLFKNDANTLARVSMRMRMHDEYQSGFSMPENLGEYLADDEFFSPDDSPQA